MAQSLQNKLGSYRSDLSLEELRRALAEKEEQYKSTAELRRELGVYEAMVESLRKQLEAKDSELDEAHSRASTSKQAMNGKVDKDILKNLFLSYFVAPNFRSGSGRRGFGAVAGPSVREVSGGGVRP